MLSLFGFPSGNSTLDSSMRSVGVDMTTLFQLYMIVSFLSLVVHFLQLVLTFTNLFFRLVTFLLSLVFGLFTLQFTLMMFFLTLPLKTMVWLNGVLGSKILIAFLLTIVAYVYFCHDLKSFQVPDAGHTKHYGKLRKEL